MTRQMTGAKMVVQALKDQGVDTVFGYPGGAVLPIYDEVFLQNDIRHILVRHEQGAVHAAEGYAVPRESRALYSLRRDQTYQCSNRSHRCSHGQYSLSRINWSSSNFYDWLRCFSRS